MTNGIKKGLAALLLVAIISFGTYAFATRAADTSNGTSQTPSMGTTPANPNTGSTNPSTGTTNPNMNNGATTTPNGQTGTVVPQATPVYGGYAAVPAYGAGESLGDLIVLNGLFGSGANAVTQTTTTGDGDNDADDTTTVTTNGVNGINGFNGNADLAGLIAVNNLLSPYSYGGGYGGYVAAPAYGGYAASPAYGYGAGYGAGDTLGGLIVLNGLFGNNGVTATTTTTTNNDPTTTVTTNGNGILGNGLNGISPDARGLAGLIAVNNLTSPFGSGIGGGYGGYVAAPAYGGYAASPAYGVGYGGGETLGGLIVLNGLFGNNGTTVTQTTTNNDPTTTVTTNGNGVLGNGILSTSARDLAGLIAVNNTTSPMGGIRY